MFLNIFIGITNYLLSHFHYLSCRSREYTSNTNTTEHLREMHAAYAMAALLWRQEHGNKMKIIIFRRTTYFNAPNNFHWVVFSAYLSLNIITSELAAACASILQNTPNPHLRAENLSRDKRIVGMCKHVRPCRSAYHQRLKEISRRRYAKS